MAEACARFPSPLVMSRCSSRPLAVRRAADDTAALPSRIPHKKPCTMPGAAGFTNRAVSSAHGAACALGSVLARLAATANAATAASAGEPVGCGKAPSPGVLAWAALSADALPAALSSVAAAIGHPVSLLHVAACGAVGRVGAAGPLPVRSSAAAAAVVPPAIVGGGDDSNVAAAAAPTTVQAVFERMWAACKLGETTDASRRTEAAAEALGRCCRGNGVGRADAGGGGGEKEPSARVRKTLRVLFDMAKNQVRVREKKLSGRHPKAHRPQLFVNASQKKGLA